MLQGPELLRAINKQRVLKLIRAAGPISRADAAQQCGLTRPTISAVVSELMDEGWIEEVGIGESSGGRPPILLRFNPRARWVVGAELGAGHVRAVLADLSGQVVRRVKHRVSSSDPAIEVGRLEASIAEVLEATPTSPARPVPVAGIGVGVTGLVGRTAGLWRYSPHYAVRDFPLARRLRERFGLPVTIENDARAMAWGERSFGGAKGVETLAYIRVGVGIGAGLIIGSALYDGAHAGAGELGHTVVEESGPRCRCGSSGCLETLASAVAIARRAAQKIEAGHPTSLPRDDLTAIIATNVIQAAEQGDLLARETLAEAGRYLGLGIANLINLLDPAMVVVGGGTSRAGDLLLDPAREAARSRTLPALRERVQIRLTALGEDSCPLGGAALVLEELFRSPVEA